MMTDFKKHFGADPRFLKSQATYIELDETFRFDSSISESTKNLISVERVWNALFEHNLNRLSNLLIIGGGEVLGANVGVLKDFL